MARTLVKFVVCYVVNSLCHLTFHKVHKFTCSDLEAPLSSINVNWKHASAVQALTPAKNLHDYHIWRAVDLKWVEFRFNRWQFGVTCICHICSHSSQGPKVLILFGRFEMGHCIMYLAGVDDEVHQGKSMCMAHPNIIKGQSIPGWTYQRNKDHLKSFLNVKTRQKFTGQVHEAGAWQTLSQSWLVRISKQTIWISRFSGSLKQVKLNPSFWKEGPHLQEVGRWWRGRMG